MLKLYELKQALKDTAYSCEPSPVARSMEGVPLRKQDKEQPYYFKLWTASEPQLIIATRLQQKLFLEGEDNKGEERLLGGTLMPLIVMVSSEERMSRVDFSELERINPVLFRQAWIMGRDISRKFRGASLGLGIYHPGLIADIPTNGKLYAEVKGDNPTCLRDSVLALAEWHNMFGDFVNFQAEKGLESFKLGK